MPDRFGNLTQAEIDVLKEQVETLKALDTNFKNLTSIGQDVSELRKNRDAELAQLNTLIRVYEPLVKE